METHSIQKSAKRCDKNVNMFCGWHPITTSFSKPHAEMKQVLQCPLTSSALGMVMD